MGGRTNPSGIVGWAFSILSLVLVIGFLVIAYIGTKDYTVELQATKIKEINLNEDREVIGYGHHGRVYDKPVIPVPYVSTYEYTYDGEVYELTLKQVTEGREAIRIYINENNPSDCCLAEDKVSLKELVTVERR